ncbi:hypothetical protein [Glaciihabitans sp. GrIS 2.15]|uniref:hypothetical protein n=1 Tax=Glaciihabitans sp. GrIS 2.15 TaxID=3071710 RepID=UPI002DFCF04D|nr:hypothetical protein [Glaciihabitans sp. GrIS 2.15]
MANLIVTSALLVESAEKLASIRQEFDHTDDHAGADPSIWGQSALESAMEQFAGDWGIHRAKISTAVGELHTKLEDMTAGWNDTEQKLSDSLTTEKV